MINKKKEFLEKLIHIFNLIPDEKEINEIINDNEIQKDIKNSLNKAAFLVYTVYIISKNEGNN